MREVIRYLLVPAVIGSFLGLAVTGVVFLRNTDSARPGYADAVRRAAPAVVNIYSAKVLEPAVCTEPRFREWCDRFRGRGSRQLQTSLGSGVIVSKQGYILTNNHVIQGADEIFVLDAAGRSTTARLIGGDPETDLAVIKVDSPAVSPIEIADSDEIQVGDLVLAIGNPFGLGQTVSAGIISAIGRSIVSESPFDDFIQTDAAINPGNSGGALINPDGRLIGINTLVYNREGSQGLGFALPSRLAVTILEEIISTGRVTRGWLGIGLSSPLSAQGFGLLVTDISPASPAERAGLVPGDMLIEIDGSPAGNLQYVTRYIAGAHPGTSVNLTIVRGNRQLEMNATTGARPSANGP